MSKETDVCRGLLGILDVLRDDIVSSLATLRSDESIGINDENLDMIVNIITRSTEKAKDFGVNQLSSIMKK